MLNRQFSEMHESGTFLRVNVSDAGAAAVAQAAAHPRWARPAPAMPTPWDAADAGRRARRPARKVNPTGTTARLRPRTFRVTQADAPPTASP
jgi:hypothetical protein